MGELSVSDDCTYLSARWKALTILFASSRAGHPRWRDVRIPNTTVLPVRGALVRERSAIPIGGPGWHGILVQVGQVAGRLYVEFCIHTSPTEYSRTQEFLSTALVPRWDWGYDGG